MGVENTQELTRSPNEIEVAVCNTSLKTLEAVNWAIDTLLADFNTDSDFDKGAKVFTDNLKEILKINK